METLRATNAFKVPFLDILRKPAWREKSLHQRSSNLKGPVKARKTRSPTSSSFHTLGASQCGFRASFLPTVSSQEPAVPHATYPLSF